MTIRDKLSEIAEENYRDEWGYPETDTFDNIADAILEEFHVYEKYTPVFRDEDIDPPEYTLESLMRERNDRVADAVGAQVDKDLIRACFPGLEEGTPIELQPSHEAPVFGGWSVPGDPTLDPEQWYGLLSVRDYPQRWLIGCGPEVELAGLSGADNEVELYSEPEPPHYSYTTHHQGWYSWVDNAGVVHVDHPGWDDPDRAERTRKQIEAISRSVDRLFHE